MLPADSGPGVHILRGASAVCRAEETYFQIIIAEKTGTDGKIKRHRVNIAIGDAFILLGR